MKVWITKYALSTGIQEVDGVICNDVSDQMLKYGNCHYAHGEGRQWHRTHEGAVKYAEAMRVKKIISLKSQIARLEKRKFML